MNSIESCQDYAIELRQKGYNCAQCVLMTISRQTGNDEDLASRLSAAYGGGFSGTGEMCGALSILGMAEGLISKASTTQDKVTAMKCTKALYQRFKDENDGRVLCRELKGKENARQCPDLIKQAIRIFFEQHPELLQKE